LRSLLIGLAFDSSNTPNPLYFLFYSLFYIHSETTTWELLRYRMACSLKTEVRKMCMQAVGVVAAATEVVLVLVEEVRVDKMVLAVQDVTAAAAAGATKRKPGPIEKTSFTSECSLWSVGCLFVCLFVCL
jgi:hypothetical protein